MATTPGQKFVRRHDAARGTTANGTAADISYDTAVYAEGGYTWSSPEVTVDEAGLSDECLDPLSITQKIVMSV